MRFSFNNLLVCPYSWMQVVNTLDNVLPFVYTANTLSSGIDKPHIP